MRIRTVLSLASIVSLAASPLAAQDREPIGQAGSPPQTINILVPVPSTEGSDLPGQSSDEECTPERNGQDPEDQITVCGSLPDENAFYYSGSPQSARDRYARETAFADVIRAPGVAGPGIFTGPATVGGICGIGLNPCPPPVAIIVDFTTLPDAPVNSDAQRIAQGLPPLSETGEDERRALSDFEKRELGLPPPLDEPAEAVQPDTSGTLNRE